MRKILTLFLIVRKSILDHLFTSLTALISVALATALLISVFSIKDRAREAFTESTYGYNAVVGTGGSELGITLNTVYQMGSSPWEIPWSVYEKLKKDPAVDTAVPYIMGDSYKGFRIVGTTSDIYKKIGYEKNGKYELKGPGRLFEPNKKEAVIGRSVADKTDLKIGSKFHPYHGMGPADQREHKEEIEVVGILNRTNTPVDRVIWLPYEQLYRLDGHVLRGAGAEYRPDTSGKIPKKYMQISAVMLQLRDAQAGSDIKKILKDEGVNAKLVWPVEEIISDLFSELGWFSSILKIVIYTIVFLSVCLLTFSLYYTVESRQREFALLRVLGGDKALLLSSVLLESLVITLLGIVAGYIFYGFIISTAAYIISSEIGIVINIFGADPVMIIVPLVMIFLGIMAGVIPALKAYSTNVPENLNSWL